MKYTIKPQNAARIKAWLATRGGLAVWGCLDLGNVQKTWTTPLLDEHGHPVTKPHWSATNEPVRVIADPGEVFVAEDEEFQRFHVKIEQHGLSVRCSPASSRRINRAVERAGEYGYYEFDYDTQEVVIYKLKKLTVITEYTGEGQ